jgi:hypothetical protein
LFITIEGADAVGGVLSTVVVPVTVEDTVFVSALANVQVHDVIKNTANNINTLDHTFTF